MIMPKPTVSRNTVARISGKANLWVSVLGGDMGAGSDNVQALSHGAL